MSYSVHQLSPCLVMIVWTRTPLPHEAKDFIQTLQTLLDKAHQPQYFISDLRRGQIVDVRIIHQLSALTRHHNWAGSTAFSQSPISKLFLGSFRKMVTASDKNMTFDRPEDAIAFLEALSPDLTSTIDWPHIIGGDTRSNTELHDS
jgi:hypothetical protein